MNHILLYIIGFACLYYIYVNFDIVKKSSHSSESSESPFHKSLTKSTTKQVIQTNEIQDTIQKMNNPKVEMYLRKLRPYRKYNKVSYDRGKQYLLQFTYYVSQLLASPANPRHIYENAEVSYKAGVNELQSLTLSVPTHGLNHYIFRSMKSDKHRIKDHSDEIGKMCKEIKDYCHNVLHSFSTDINQQTYNSPNIYKSEIVQYDIVGYNEVHPNMLY